jgi:hypothetical protein
VHCGRTSTATVTLATLQYADGTALTARLQCCDATIDGDACNDRLLWPPAVTATLNDGNVLVHVYELVNLLNNHTAGALDAADTTADYLLPTYYNHNTTEVFTVLYTDFLTRVRYIPIVIAFLTASALFTVSCLLFCTVLVCTSHKSTK